MLSTAVVSNYIYIDLEKMLNPSWYAKTGKPLFPNAIIDRELSFRPGAQMPLNKGGFWNPVR